MEKVLSSQASSSSKSGMSNKSAARSPVVQGIKADQYAQQKLGIRKTVAGPVQGARDSVTGFYSTTSPNQMYGQEYSAARNEYLASQNLGSVTDTGQYRPFVQTDKGQVSTLESRQAYEASRQEPIPLSRQMYDSQKMMMNIGGAIATGLTGMPSFFSSAYYASKKPYSQYVDSYMNKAKTNLNKSSSNASKTTNNQQTITVKDTPKVANDFDAAARGDQSALRRIEALSRQNEASSPNRKFLVSSAKTFLGKMQSGTLDSDYNTF
tara:strand:- start:87 stop:884 length:798 start_codon:yes stop_codon:yes gene_type:complete